MQIHEITTNKLNEGILDAIKSGITGAKQGYQISQTNRAVQMIADKAYPIWANYAKRLEQSITDPVAKQAFVNRTDGLYQRALTAFVEKNLLKNVGLDNAVNKDQITKLIKQLSEPKNVAKKPAPVATAPVTAPGSSTIVNPATNKPFTPTPVSEALDATTEKQLFTQLVQAASLALPDTERRQPHHQAQLINQDPAIVRMDGRTYGLNDNGEWADIKTGRKPEGSTTAYLDQIAGI